MCPSTLSASPRLPTCQRGGHTFPHDLDVSGLGEAEGEGFEPSRFLADTDSRSSRSQGAREAATHRLLRAVARGVGHDPGPNRAPVARRERRTGPKRASLGLPDRTGLKTSAPPTVLQGFLSKLSRARQSSRRSADTSTTNSRRLTTRRSAGRQAPQPRRAARLAPRRRRRPRARAGSAIVGRQRARGAARRSADSSS